MTHFKKNILPTFLLLVCSMPILCMDDVEKLQAGFAKLTIVSPIDAFMLETVFSCAKNGKKSVLAGGGLHWEKTDIEGRTCEAIETNKCVGISFITPKNKIPKALQNNSLLRSKTTCSAFEDPRGRLSYTLLLNTEEFKHMQVGEKKSDT